MLSVLFLANAKNRILIEFLLKQIMSLIKINLKGEVYLQFRFTVQFLKTDFT